MAIGPETGARRHVLLYCYAEWGHTRPLCNLGTRIVKAKPNVDVTILTSPSFYERCKVEISRDFTEEEQHIARNVRLVSLESDASTLTFTAADAEFAALYEGLVKEGSITCAISETQFDGLSQPNIVVLDHVISTPLADIKRLSPAPVKILAWLTGSVSYCLMVWGPANKGGLLESYMPLIEMQAANEGKQVEDVVNDLLLTSRGQVIDVPGVPKMYDWELQPQPMPDIPVGAVCLRSYDFFRKCDGAIFTSTPAMEPQAISAFADWYTKTGRAVYSVGPILAPSSKESHEGELQTSEKAVEIGDFLDKALTERGEHSVLYVSFGSFWWPADPTMVWTFLDTVIEAKMPFIMSHGSPFASVPDEVAERVEKSGLGILTPWAPQQMILAHKATGWFLSHCGHNSVLESLVEGVPIIAWPYGIDQVFLAAQVADEMHVGYELFEGRTGELGLKEIMRTGKKPKGTPEALKKEVQAVLAKARGADGALKRKRAQELKREMIGGWDKGGVAATAFEQFLEELFAKPSRSARTVRTRSRL